MTTQWESRLTCEYVGYSSLGFINDSLKLGLVQNSFFFTSTKYTRISFMDELRLMWKEMLVAYFETIPNRTQANRNEMYDRLFSR